MTANNPIFKFKDSEYTKVRKEQSIRYHEKKIAEIQKYGPYGRPLRCPICDFDHSVRFYVYTEYFDYGDESRHRGLAYCVRCRNRVYSSQLYKDSEYPIVSEQVKTNQLPLEKLNRLMCPNRKFEEFFMYRTCGLEYGHEHFGEIVECIRCFTVTEIDDELYASFVSG